MTETPVSLLDRLRERPDPQSWQLLVDLYTPLIRRWLGRYGLQAADADDLVQEVLRVLVRELPGYKRADRPGAFRAWLRAIALNHLRMHWRARRADPAAGARPAPEDLEDTGGGLERLWDEEHDRHVARRLLELIEAEFTPATRQAFRRLVLDDRRAEEVAAELGLSVNAVYIAKSRVLGRLRQEIRGLID